MHLNALRAMGARELEGEGHVLEAPNGLTGASMYLEEASVTGTETALLAAAAARGVTEIRHAACEPHVVELCQFLRKKRGPIRSVGLGDSPNDLPMLKAVDLPVVVMRHGGIHDLQLQEGVPHALLASGVGPVGWNAAVLELLADERW